MKRFLQIFVIALLGLSLSCSKKNEKRVLVLGIDGADPIVLKRMMDAGELPNFSRLADLGDFRELGTSNPPQSPVAWATFTTGLDPGGHGIFDFIHRDPKTMKLRPSMSEVDDDGKAVLLRQGAPFWAYLKEADVSTTLLKVAANFPPDGLPGSILTGMGTPDLEGSYGTFSYYTTSSDEPPPELSGGRFVPVQERDGLIRASLVGPGEEILPLEVSRSEKSALINIGKQKHLILNTGEWSDWVPVKFPSAPGMARFYLQAVTPHLRLYVSPVNIDPCEPVQAVSSPQSFSRHLCRCCGRFYTQGMPEDTKALVHGIFSDDEFLAQSDLVLQERKRLFEQGLKEFEHGLFFFYLSTTDIVSHLYWNTIDPHHPGYNKERAEKHGKAIEQAYKTADSYVGRLLKEADENTVILVLSDHGFAPFYREFGLNAWLESEGYLKLSAGATNWNETTVYGAGFNGLYVNLRGREVTGQVEADEREALLDEIAEKLLALKDPESGDSVVSKVYRSEDIYHGEFKANAPDLIVGYNRGYRASWQTALGNVEGGIFQDNLKAWSGDHLMDAALVPGVILANRTLEAGDASLTDIAPTILTQFGVEVPEDMLGRNILR